MNLFYYRRSLGRLVLGLALVHIAALSSYGLEAVGNSPEQGSAAVKVAKPIITVDQATHDFGTTWEGPKLKHEFKITNQGDAKLEITKVKPGCGCTIAGSYPKTLAPGESGLFPFTLDSKKVHGQYSKPIKILSNDPATPTLKLNLKGECKWYINVKPSRACLGSVYGQETKSSVLSITNNTETPLKLALDPEASTGPFKFELTEKEAGKNYELKVTAVGPFEKPGLLKATAAIKTNLESKKELGVRASVSVRERLEVYPSILRIPPAAKGSEAGSSTTKTLRFLNSGEKPVKVIEVSVDDPSCKATVTEQSTGKEYRVNLEIPAGYQLPDKGCTVTIKTDDTEKPLIKIPVRKDNKKCASRQTGRPKPVNPLINKEAPDFKLTTMAGKTVSNDTVKGAVTVLNFFAANCGFCKKQLPRVEAMRAIYEPKGVRFVNVSQKMGKKAPSQDEVVTLLKKFEAKSELALDSDNKVGKSFKANGFPTMVILSQAGVIRAVNRGNKSDLEERMKTQLDTLIKEKSLSAATPRN